jgi:hypothetical protein
VLPISRLEARSELGFEMGRVETDWGRAGWATWACWAVKKQSPSPSVWVGSVSPTRPEARRAHTTRQDTSFRPQLSCFGGEKGGFGGRL